MTVRDGTRGRNSKDAQPSSGDERTSGANYRELLSIGSGGSANISIAIAEGIAGFSKLVVLKTIREELIANGAATKMFLDEARVSARMNHPNVVQVYEVFLRREIPVIVMEFLDGQPLNSVLAGVHDSKSLTLEVSISILAKVLAGLHYAHTLTDFSGQPLGLVHRDVSPHNVMLTYDGQVKLVDFGIAKLANAEHQTRTGVIKGKLTYMAPEQFTGKVDSRVDIFAVGVMLWELVTRQRFWGDLPEPELIGRLIAGDLPHLRRPPAIDDELYRICCQALAVRPEERFGSAAEMQEELERYLAKRGAFVTPVAIGRLVTETCAEARRKVQAGIREQLSQRGLSLTSSIEGLSQERVHAQAEPRETLSGERLRPRHGSRDAPTRGFQIKAGVEQTTAGGLRSKGVEQTTPGGLRKKLGSEQTTPGGLRTKPGSEQTTTGGLRRKLGGEPTTTGGLRSKPGAGDAWGGERLDLAPTTGDPSSSEAAPLRLFGGVAPTARAGVALAGFGMLAVLVLALGLATPKEPGAAAQAPALTASSAPGQSPSAERARAVRINASAQPPEASWYLDDQKLDSNPIEVSVPTDGAVHTLRAEAPGFEPYIQSVRFDADIDVKIALTRK